MQIDCATTNAAAQVLFVLIDAQLRPGEAFYITGRHLAHPPIRFTLRVPLPAPMLRQLQAIPDVTIAGARGA